MTSTDESAHLEESGVWPAKLVQNMFDSGKQRVGLELRSPSVTRCSQTQVQLYCSYETNTPLKDRMRRRQYSVVDGKVVPRKAIDHVLEYCGAGLRPAIYEL